MALGIRLAIASELVVVQEDDIRNRPLGAPLSGSEKTDPRNSVFVEIGSGALFSDAPHYCLCDGGPQQAIPDTNVSYAAGSWVYDYPWSGRTWDGPSDTNNPERGFFPLGNYTANVTFFVDDARRITLALPFDVVP
jgi:hypothetical protein